MTYYEQVNTENSSPVFNALGFLACVFWPVTDRFGPRNVIDNKTWELPIDGVVDYTVGTITSMQSFG